MYEVEDVIATIFYGFQTNQHRLVLHAVNELRASNEHDLLVNVISMAWLLCDPYVCPMVCAPTKDTLYECICTLFDHFPSELPNYKSQIPIPQPKSWEELDTVLATCFQKKYVKQCIRIMTMLLHKQSELCCKQFEIYGISKSLLIFDRIVYLPLAERLVQHLVIQRMHPATPHKNAKKYMSTYTSIWNDINGGRKGRTFQIPFHALQQWNLKPKSSDRIQNALIPVAITSSDASIYWQTAGTPTNTNDETMEEWYATHFPDDIPDEWSREEIEKSHVLVVPAPAPAPAQIPVKNDWVSAFLLC
jgi:hypothetical protein